MPSDGERRRTYRVSQHRALNTYALLGNASWHALQDGRERVKGSFFEWMTAGVFAAFSLEAYLNHLGERRIRHWGRIERGLSVSEKLDLLLADLGQAPDLSRRPFQTVSELVKFRNELAHGKTQRLSETSTRKLFSGQSIPEPLTWWERQCTERGATRFHEDVRAVIEQLHAWAGLDALGLFSPGECETMMIAQR